MQEELYAVVLRFDPGDAGSCAQVHAFLKGFKGLDRGRIETALKKGRLLLKRNADYATALKLQQRIRLNGATCSLEKQSPRQVGSVESLKHPSLEQKLSDGAAGEIICPKCRTRQPAQAECRYCGVIFAKLRVPAKTADIQAENPQVHSAVKPAPDEQERTETSLQRHLPAMMVLSARLTQWHRNLQQWSQKPLNALFNCAMLFLTALFLEVMILFMGKYLWFFYSATLVGEHYSKAFNEVTAVIEALLGRDPMLMAWEVVSLVLVINLLVALIAQITYLSRLYLDGGGLILKLIWIIPSTLGAAWLLSQRDPMPPLAMAFPLTLLPTACLLGGCLNLARTLLPEMGVVLSEISRAVRHRDNLLTALKNVYRHWGRLKTGEKTAPTPVQGDMDA